jgi:Cu(I)/Ag(I) efflux system protein CusF
MKTFASAVVIALLGATAAIGADMPAMKMSPAAAINHTTGVVKALDVAKGTVTLSHEAVPAIKWPAMTMTFKISSAQAAGIKTGDRVDFEFTASGMDATITKIAVAK